MNMKAILIAGTVSGVGKTTIATGIMGALRRRGYRVQPFKTGPDYIDPGYHNSATGEISRNLDTWLLSSDTILELFSRAMQGKNIAIIEGVMGLYDGHSAISDEGSTAELAKLLGVPVVLVVDSRKGARSIAAMVKGYADFDPDINICGVILNGVGSDVHLEFCRKSIETYTGIPVVGYLNRRDYLSLPERHLGLIPTIERPASDQFLEHLIAECEDKFDMEKILSLSQRALIPTARMQIFPQPNKAPVVRIGVARDIAFSFYYQDSLDLLEACGAELEYFSPVTDSKIPDDISGLYIGGGFPELYAAELSANEPMKDAVKIAAEKGMPIYAECGGLMYLGKSLRDLEGRKYTMSEVIPLNSRIDTPRLSLGYRTVQALSDGPLLLKGETVRGHEFHWSILSGENNDMKAYQIIGSDRTEGFTYKNTLSSYVHLHMASHVPMVERFIGVCHKFSQESFVKSGNFDIWKGKKE